MDELAELFSEFPDDENEIRCLRLGYFRYSATGKVAKDEELRRDAAELVAAGFLRADPVIYEDFLPVSAAGIFQSNLGDEAAQVFSANPNRDLFEAALGMKVIDLHSLYAETEASSLALARAEMSRPPAE